MRLILTIGSTFIRPVLGENPFRRVRYIDLSTYLVDLQNLRDVDFAHFAVESHVERCIHSPMPVFGGGMAIRDLRCVDIHCRVLRTVLEHGYPRGADNSGGGPVLPNVEVSRRIFELMERRTRLNCQDADRPGSDGRRPMDSTTGTVEIRCPDATKPRSAATIESALTPQMKESVCV